MRACFVRSCCCVVVPEHDLRATPVQCNVKQTLSSHFTPHTPHFTLALHLNSSHLSSSHLIPCLPICQLSSSWLFSCQLLPSTDVYYKSLQKLFPSTTLYHKACTNYLTSQYYFVLQSLHILLPSTTLYYKACTNYFPVLMSTTKACTNYFPVLLCATKLAQITSQY